MNGLAAIGAGITMGIGAIGPAVGIALIASRAIDGMARQPELRGPIQTTMLIGIAFTEAIALFALVMAFILSAK